MDILSYCARQNYFSLRKNNVKYFCLELIPNSIIFISYLKLIEKANNESLNWMYKVNIY